MKNKTIITMILTAILLLAIFSGISIFGVILNLYDDNPLLQIMRFMTVGITGIIVGLMIWLAYK